MDQNLHCPGCCEAVMVPAESVGKWVKCPYCNIDFFASPERLHLQIVDDTPIAVEDDREAAFDKLRIENFTALRMGAIRARTWWLIALCLSILVILDTVGKTVIEVVVFHRWGVWPTVNMILVSAAILLARHAWRRAREFKKEIEISAIPEPTIPPDFSTLDNGSDHWKHLENVR